MELGQKLARPLTLAMFCAAVGFLPFPVQRVHVLAAPAAGVAFTDEVKSRASGEVRDSSRLDHEFSDYTRRLLEAVSVLLQKVEDVKSSKGDMNGVQEALREVKARGKEVQKEVLDLLNLELRVLRREKADLIKRSGEVLDSSWTAGKERDRLLNKGVAGAEVKEKVEDLERSIGLAEEEYTSLWEKVGEIDDHILRRETSTFSIVIRELSFIERESELLVERFRVLLKQEGLERFPE